MTAGGLDAGCLRPIVEHFERTFARHGASARGVDWRGESAQAERLEILVAEILSTPEASVCDLGCAYGPLLDALRAAAHTGRYVGVDISSDLIQAAAERHGGDTRASFRVGAAPQPADLIVASGLFSLRLGAGDREWREHVDATLGLMVRCARRAVLVNFLLAGALPQATPHLYFDDPKRITGVLLDSGATDVRIVTKPGLADFTAVARVGATAG